jgi:peptidoglycan/xylan/chitin deacetylase (PgdA/CDA1 family)
MTSLVTSPQWRSWIAGALDSAPFGAILRALEASDRGRGDILAVLTYHRVAPRDGLVGFPGLVSATPDRFAEQMEHLAQRYSVIDMTDVLAARTGRALPRRSVLVSFDDGYRDFAEHAWPVLRRLRLPATLFVPTAYADENAPAFWWDRLYEALATARPGTVVNVPSAAVHVQIGEDAGVTFRQLRGELKARSHDDLLSAVDLICNALGAAATERQVLTWDELRSLASEGVTLAPHSRTHPLLPNVPATALDAELVGSLADLQARFGNVPRAFAYPSGAESADVREAVGRAGYDVAFTTRRGLNRLGVTDWLALRRINVGRATSLIALRAQIGRWAIAMPT